MKEVSVGCTTLDTLLRGGLQPGILTLIYGEPGTGKTNICILASCTNASKEKKVVYITSEGVSQERLRQVCKKKNKKPLENILFFSPENLEEQEKIIEKALKIRCLLLVIDTINKFYRLQLSTDKDAADRSLTRQMVTLQLAAKKRQIPIILTGQVYQNETGVKPFANRIISPLAKTIIQLKKQEYQNTHESEPREAIVIKHPYYKTKEKIRFFITAQGLE
jgi:DNA repair protein RadB